MMRGAPGSPVAALARTRAHDAVVLIVLISGAPLMALMFVAVAPVLSSLAAHFGRGPDGALIAQMIMTLPGIGVILGGPVTGWLVERTGSRRTVLASLLVYSLAGSVGLLLAHMRVI